MLSAEDVGGTANHPLLPGQTKLRNEKCETTFSTFCEWRALTNVGDVDKSHLRAVYSDLQLFLSVEGGTPRPALHWLCAGFGTSVTILTPFSYSPVGMRSMSASRITIRSQRNYLCISLHPQPRLLVPLSTSPLTPSSCLSHLKPVPISAYIFIAIAILFPIATYIPITIPLSNCYPGSDHLAPW